MEMMKNTVNMIS